MANGYLREVIDAAGQAYATANRAIITTHHRTGGLSTQLFLRGAAVSAGLLTGAITLDNIVHLLTGGGHHDWTAGASGTNEPPSTPAGYGFTGQSTDNTTCMHTYKYVQIDPPTLNEKIISVRMQDCVTPDEQRAKNITTLALLVLAGLGAGAGGLVWRARHKLAAKKPTPVVGQAAATYETLETTIRGLQNSAKAGMDAAALETARANIRKELARAYAHGGLPKEKYAELRGRVS